ncbi:MAG: SEC-C metal-binding domain-containing protein, partial [Acidimicrobiia bacterium]
MDTNDTRTSLRFERTSKRRKGFPSETNVKRGDRVVHGTKELIEKLGRNDLCPCDSGRRFQELLPQIWSVRRKPSALLPPRLSNRTRTGRLAPNGPSALTAP